MVVAIGVNQEGQARDRLARVGGVDFGVGRSVGGGMHVLKIAEVRARGVQQAVGAGTFGVVGVSTIRILTN